MKKYFLFLIFSFLAVGCVLNNEVETKIQKNKRKINENSQKINKQNENIKELRSFDYSRNNKELLKRVINLEKEVELLKDRIKLLEKYRALASNEKQEVTSDRNEMKASLSSEPRNGSENELSSSLLEKYKQIRGYYQEKQYNKAISEFRKFIDNNPKSDLAANAQYWIAEAYYSLQDYATAIDEFQNVVDFYPDSHKSPDALFKVGKSYLALDMKEQAVIELERIEKMYPNYDKQNMIDNLLKEIK